MHYQQLSAYQHQVTTIIPKLVSNVIRSKKQHECRFTQMFYEKGRWLTLFNQLEDSRCWITESETKQTQKEC
jgi:hypothetical protein